MKASVKRCLELSHDSQAFSDALADLKNFDDIDLDVFWSEGDGILSRFLHSSLEECISLVKLCVALFSSGAPFSHDELCRLTAATLKSMYKYTNCDFWNLCLNTFLSAMTIQTLSNPSIIVCAMIEPRIDNVSVEACLLDLPSSISFSKFTLLVLEASINSNTTSGLPDYEDIMRFLRSVLPLVRHGQCDFVKMLANLFSSILRNNPRGSFIFDEIHEELRMVVLFTIKFFKCNTSAALEVMKGVIDTCPRVLLSASLYVSFVDFLLCLLRASPSSTGVTLHRVQLPAEALSLFLDLLRNIEACGLKGDMTSQIYMKFFDVLRAFPVEPNHSILRLLAWWRFLCFLPQKMLFDGFRRFVSPFLANLMGRYISVTASLGDPNFHRYHLSSTSVYNGDSTAQDLAAHVFSCIFEYPEIEPGQFVDEMKLPKLCVSSSFLSKHYYQLLVAVFHWLRYLSGLGKSVGEQKVGDIWTTCLKCIRQAIPDFDPVDEAFRRIFIQHSVELSLRLVSPQNGSGDSPSGSLIEPSDIDISQNPSPHDCVIILHEVADSLDFEKVSSEFKSTLNFNISVSCLSLISISHRDFCSPNFSKDLIQEDVMKDLGLLAVESVEKDARLAVKTETISTTVADHLSLSRELLLALVPECINFVDRHLELLENLYSVPLSRVTVELNTSRVNEAGLQVWTCLADRLTQLTVIHKRVTELPKGSAENKTQNLSSDLSTMFAFCLAPVFLAGNSIVSPSPELEQKMFNSLFGLFRILHSEACLLTALPINSWIDKLSDLIIALIRSEASEGGKKINLRVVSNFLSFMVNSAERVDGNCKDPFSPSKWRAHQNRPLGPITGPVDAISCCLAVLPLGKCEMSVCNSVFDSQSQRQSNRSRNLLGLRTLRTEPPSPTDLYEVVFLESVQQQQNRQPVQSVTRNLLHSLWIILQRHIPTVEMLLLLIERSSPGLLALAKRLNSEFTSFGGEEVYATIVSAFEAFVTLTWNRLQKCFCKAGLVENPEQQKAEELRPLELPGNAVRQLLMFFEAAVCLASDPISKVSCRNAVAPVINDASSTSLGRNKPITYDSPISRRYKLFILCIVSLWDTLIVSTPAEATDLRDKIRDLTCQFSKCLVNVASPLISLRRRATFPDWISPDLLAEEIEERNEVENDPPRKSTRKSAVPRKGRRNPQSSKAVKGNRGATPPRLTSERRHGQTSELEQVHGLISCPADSASSSLQTPPKQSVYGSFLASRRLGTSTDPRDPPLRRPYIVTRRRLSLTAPQATDQFSVPDDSDLPSSAPVPQQVQCRLFDETFDNKSTAGALSSTSMVSSVMPPPRSRKRMRSVKSDSKPLSKSIDLEESTQFVSIPPRDPAGKRMRLTEHQKERRRDQKFAYLPSMYNNLDVNVLSENSNLCPTDSQSSVDSSQSFMHSTQNKAPDQFSEQLEQPPAVDTGLSHLSTKTVADNGSTSCCNVVSPSETLQTSQKATVGETAGGPDAESPHDAFADNVTFSKPAFEEEAPTCLGLELSEDASEDDDEVEKTPTTVNPSILTDTKSQEEETSIDAKIETTQQYDPPSSPVRSAMLSASPMVSRVGTVILRSPSGGPAGIRAQKILEMGLAKAAERIKQRNSLSVPKTNLQYTFPGTSPVIKQFDSPGNRPGILRDITSPRPKTRVSFVEQPTVFILDSSGSSCTNSQLTGGVSSTKAAPFALTNSTEVALSGFPNSQPAEMPYSSVDAKLHPDNPVTSDAKEIRLMVNYSPPSLSSLVNNRRKMTSPRRYSPIGRPGRECLRCSPVGSADAGIRTRTLTRRRLFAVSGHHGSPVHTRGSTQVDLDALTARGSSPLKVFISNDSLFSPFPTKIVAGTNEEVVKIEASADNAIDENLSINRPASLNGVIEETQEIVGSKEEISDERDVVESSQEPDDPDATIAFDSEAEQTEKQVNNCGEEAGEQPKETEATPADNTSEVTSENVPPGDTVECVRQTLGVLREQLSLLSDQQIKELLFEALSLFKTIIP